jgi:hypothetical protein
MKKIAWVVSNLSSGGSVCIPVLYSITCENGDPDIKLISCKVAAKPAHLPEWLSPGEFTIRHAYKNGCNDVGISSSGLGSICCTNADAARFIISTHDAIKAMELVN